MYGLWLRYRDGDRIKKDMARAVYWLTRSAEAGQDEAQIKLGDMYYNGEWFEQDKNKAAYWYDKGSDKYVEYRHDEDLLDYKIWVKLYHMYTNGDEIEPNPKRAEHFRNRLKEAGHESMLNEPEILVIAD